MAHEHGAFQVDRQGFLEMNFGERVFLLLEINHTDAIPTVVVAVKQKENQLYTSLNGGHQLSCSHFAKKSLIKWTEQTTRILERINEHNMIHR